MSSLLPNFFERGGLRLTILPVIGSHGKTATVRPDAHQAQGQATQGRDLSTRARRSNSLVAHAGAARNEYPPPLGEAESKDVEPA
jgi:hypothetical protein